MDNQEKKVYVAPQMIVEECDCQGALLNCSGPDLVVCEESEG
jgi:hypothetical protein